MAFSTFLLFLTAFDPQVPFLPNGVGFTFLVAIFLFPLVLVKAAESNLYYKFLFKSVFFPIVSLFFLSFLFIVLRLFFNQGENVLFSLSWFKAFFVFLSCFFVYFVFYAGKDSSLFMNGLVFIYSLNALVNLLVGTYPEQFSFLKIFKVEAISESVGRNPYRGSFISGSGYYSIGTAYGLVFLLFAFHVVVSKSRSALVFASIALTGISGFIAARTSFFAIAPALLYIFKARFLYFALFVLISFLLVYFLIQMPALQPYKYWMLSFFSLAGDASGGYLVEKMYFWPGDSAFFIGLGAVNDGTFVYTDAGYMQDVLFGGIFFLALKLSFLIFFLFFSFKRYPLFSTSVVFAILLFHFKGLFIYNNAQGMAAFYFIIFYLYGIDKNSRYLKFMGNYDDEFPRLVFRSK